MQQETLVCNIYANFVCSWERYFASHARWAKMRKLNHMRGQGLEANRGWTWVVHKVGQRKDLEPRVTNTAIHGVLPGYDW